MRIFIAIFIFGLSFVAKANCRTSVRDAVLVVGPYSSGVHLAPLIRERGLRPIAVVPSISPTGYSFNENDFSDVWVVSDSNVSEVTQHLIPLAPQIAAVVPGSEWDPKFADDIRQWLSSRHYQQFGNTPSLSQARTDKIAFYQTLKYAGLAAPHFFSSSNFNEIEQWWKLQYKKWPVVVKPPANAGGAKVRFCYSLAEMKDAFDAILSEKTNSMRRHDTSVIVQEPFDSPEFAVNGVVIGNRVIINGIWSYERKRIPGAGTIYVTDRLRTVFTDADYRLLKTTREVLKAVQHRVGPFHLEMFDHPERGPVPIDFGARLSGGGLPHVERFATNLNPFSLTLDSFLWNTPQQRVNDLYQAHSHAAVVFISTDGIDGARASHSVSKELDQLKASGNVESYSFRYPEGTPLQPTRDDDTVVAVITVVGSSHEEIERSVSLLRNWEASRRFETTLAP